MNKLIVIALYLLVVATFWNAMENHIANLGVYAWQREMSQIQQFGNDGMPGPTSKPSPSGRTYRF